MGFGHQEVLGIASLLVEPCGREGTAGHGHSLKGWNWWRTGIWRCKQGTRHGIASEGNGGPEAGWQELKDMELFRMSCGQDWELEESDDSTNFFSYSIIPDPSPSRPPPSGWISIPWCPSLWHYSLDLVCSARVPWNSWGCSLLWAALTAGEH